jgi:alkylation response protein AidB-like acyl-CoA dehydrogenase
MHELLHALLVGEPLAASAPIDRALVGGRAAGGVGGAFLAGYQAALHALIPSLADGPIVCLCATEEGGAHPRAIATRLEPDRDGFRLSGRKKWVTGGPLAERLLVVASTGLDAAGRNRLRLALLDARQPGVTVQPMPPTPFAPEVPHAELDLDGVAVVESQLLPGDGYERYLKPFRTVEDCHVHAALQAYLVGVARRFGWPHATVERLLGLVCATRALALADPSAPTTHVALAGVLDGMRRFTVESEPHWALADAGTRAAWQRDLPLLEVAGRARAARTEAAWKALG